MKILNSKIDFIQKTNHCFNVNVAKICEKMLYKRCVLCQTDGNLLNWVSCFL